MTYVHELLVVLKGEVVLDPRLNGLQSCCDFYTGIRCGRSYEGGEVAPAGEEGVAVGEPRPDPNNEVMAAGDDGDEQRWLRASLSESGGTWPWTEDVERGGAAGRVWHVTGRTGRPAAANPE